MIVSFRTRYVRLRGFDDAYLQRLRLGDAATEREFVLYFSELIRIKLRSRLRDAALVEDVRQETFLRVLRVLRSAEGLRDPACLGAFVNSVCNNVLLETLRAKGRHRTPTEAEEQRPIVDDVTPDPERRLLSEERRAIVRRVLDSLPSRDRAVLQAIFLEEREKDEVCAQLGVGRDYLRVLLHRAKSQFRTSYSERGGASGARRDHGAPLARPLGG
jgi:RNA polymerase sigma-70 factor, ECF subfamily